MKKENQIDSSRECFERGARCWPFLKPKKKVVRNAKVQPLLLLCESVDHGTARTSSILFSGGSERCCETAKPRIWSEEHTGIAAVLVPRTCLHSTINNSLSPENNPVQPWRCLCSKHGCVSSSTGSRSCKFDFLTRLMSTCKHTTTHGS